MVTTDPKKRLNIMIVATERPPFASVGGIGSVIDYLTMALLDLGHNVSVFIPKFGIIDEKKFPLEVVCEGLKVPTGSSITPELVTNVKKFTSEKSGTTYFLENLEYYEQRANVYGYVDDALRFLLLCKGALEFIKASKIHVDIIHANDWHAGYVPNLIKTEYANDPVIGKISTLFTIHNLSYQGTRDFKNASEMDFDDGKSLIPEFFSERLNHLNSMKRGIIYADVVNTVSKTYAKEILTPEYGEGLDKLLIELQEKLYGVINGLDYDDFNPAKDSRVHSNFDVDHLDKRIANKDKLQLEFGLPQDPTAFVIGNVGRLAPMKGIDMAVNVLRRLLKNYNMQFVQIGGGDVRIRDMLLALQREFPSKVGVHPSPNFTLPRLLFAGSDAIIYPSRFEPCGIVQIEALRYGAIPIVRHVGGLADTVNNFDRTTMEGNGFVFKDFDEFELYGAIIRAHETFKDKDTWKRIQINAMNSNYSWKNSAEEYVKLYHRALKKQEAPKNVDRAFEKVYG